MAFDTKAFNAKAKEAAKAGIEGLPDGEYEMALVAMSLKELTGETIILVREAIVLGGPKDGHVVKWDTFLCMRGEVKERAVKQVTDELDTIGFPASAWLDEERWYEQVQMVASSKIAEGIRFKVKKKVNESNGKTYHNLDIKARLSGDAKPDKFTDEMLKTANAESIPF